MSIATARHYLNGVDVWEAYGLAIRGGSASFMTKPKVKEGLSHNWPDENDTQYDLSVVVFEGKQAVLTCSFVVDDEVELKTKRNAFFNSLCSPGYQKWRVDDNDEIYLVRYIAESGTDKPLRRLKNVPKSILEFSLTLGVSVNEEDVANAGNGLPAIVYNTDGSIWKILMGGESAILPDASGIPFTHPFTGSQLEAGSRIALPWPHQEGDKYEVYVVGFKQPEAMWLYAPSNNSIILDEPVPATFSGEVIKYPKA